MAKKYSFEEALHRLEAITTELENNDVSLDNTLKKFEEGMQLADFCNRQLEDAQKRIDILVKKDGLIQAVPFDPESTPE